MHFSTWNVDASQILSRQELAAVLKDLKRRAARPPNVQMNLAIVRLACCCGLRASEIGGLTLGDVRVGIARPHLLVRAEHAKLNRPRRVPLWWDAGTLADLSAWLDQRYAQGATRDDPFVCSLQTATFGEPLNRHVLRRRFHTACRVLGWDWLRNLTIHHGRHTFISHALAGGRTLAEVKAAAGHSSLLTVPTIEEVLKLVADHHQKEVLIAVDLKAEKVEQEVVRLAEQHKVFDRLLFIGRTISEPQVRERINAASTKAQTATVANNADEFPKALAASNADCVYFRYLPPKEQMEAVRGAGKRSFIAGTTVSGNVPDNWRQAAEVGIDGILTDFPFELRAMLRKGLGR